VQSGEGDVEPVPPSGIRDSERCPAATPPEPTPLAIAVAYWPDRWPMAVLEVGAAMYPMLVALEAPAWADMLDRVAAGLGVALTPR
jgi:hypothetical protein